MSGRGEGPGTIPRGAGARLGDACLLVKGPKGEVTVPMRNAISAKVDGGIVTLEPRDGSIETRALWGTYASLIKGALQGVTEGYEKKLLIEGVGYRMEVKGDKVALAVGLSHGVEVPIPKGLKVTSEKGVMTIQSEEHTSELQSHVN